MGQTDDTSNDAAPGSHVVRAEHLTSPPLEEVLDRFWDVGADFETIEVRVEPPQKPLELLEQLGPSPFARGTFPVIGFLATTYEKVSRYALERGGGK